MWICGGIWWGLEDEQVNQDLEGEGVERGGRVSYGMKKLRDSSFLRVDKLAISATSKQLQYGMSFENVCKLKTAVNSFVVSRNDYCNCLLSGAPQYQLNKLQAVMNSTERLICGLNRFDHISRVLCDRLPWLPAEQRIYTDIIQTLSAVL